ncbi:MAG: ABC transporter substrate-binding protein [Proteobacteria bacterium]|nr:ABC transporter substrate-binding protein [Pseudomonadota bacterium]
MKRLSTVVFAAVVLALVAGVASAQEWKKIRIGVEGAYPPFSWVEPDGTLKGFDIDITYALCKEIGAECELVQQDWDGIIPALLANKYDAIIASMSITEERKKKVAFTNKYYNTPAKFVRKKGSGIEINKDSLKGKSVGVQRATIHENFLRDNYGGVIDIKAYATQDEANMDLVSGRVDLVLADSVALLDGFLSTDNGKGFEFVGPDFTDPRWFGDGVGIALRKQDSDLRDLLNKAIAQIRSDGTYQKINAKFFDFDVYGQ